MLRYRIVAARDEHVAAYDAMIKRLRGVGFRFRPPLEQHADTDREDPNKSYLTGVIASDKLVGLLANPSIASVLAMPEDFVYPPNELDKTARVRLELSGGLSPDRQRELAEQVKAVLAVLGFREAPAYDHHGHSGQAFTRLVGTIPQGRLEVLLKDLRGQPAGWFAARIPPQEVPTPLRNVNPIRIVEVLTDPEAIVTLAGPQPRSPAFLEKLSPDLWALVSAKSQGAGPARIELILAGSSDSLDESWKTLLQETAPGIFIEGRLGQVVSAVVRLRQVPALAALAPVVTLRLQRPARVDVDPALNLAGDNAKALALTGLDNLHRRGFRGQGVRLAILDTDFRGWAGFKKLGRLPPTTRLLDLTAELDSDLHGAPVPGEPSQPGHGTLCAAAAALAAPQADLVLIRIDASSPYHVDELVRYVRGESQSSAYIDRRRDELVTARAELNLLSSMVQRERRVILESYIDETDLEKDFGFLGPVYGWVFSPRTWSRAQVAHVQKLNHELTQRDRRYFDLVDGIRSLGGVTLIASPLVWNDGVAVGDASPLSRAFDRYFQPPLPTPTRTKSPLFWFQAAGNTRGQSWAGLYQDQDGNGIMEFAGPGYRLKQGQWTTELSFLAWQAFAGPQATLLPEGTRLHLSLQWREPHDPDYFASLGGADLYARPLANLKVSLLRQRDPDGKTLAADSFDLVAATFGVPQRLEHQPEGSIYEAVLEVTLDKAGRYAVQIERPTGQKWVLVEGPGGKRPTFARLEAEVPSGLRPAGVVTTPALERHWELQPRLFVDVLGPERRVGRPVFADFATDQGSVGSPGDARSVITVGAANWRNQPEPYSAGGPLAYAELAAKPTLLAYDRLQLGPPGTAGSAFGNSIAVSFAAGTTAALISARISPEAAWRYLNQHNGKVLAVPWK